jgi:glycosyltransferase involved in cell wall biosynthesis
VNPGDDEALARAALRLLEEPGLARRISGAARATYLERYTWASVRDDWVRLYRDMASARRQPHPAGA